jgi:hypothetical protein
MLGVDVSFLLSLCAAAPVEACDVLRQLPNNSLNGVPASILVDCGIRKNALNNAGYSMTSIMQQTNATPQQIHNLGYVFKI